MRRLKRSQTPIARLSAHFAQHKLCLIDSLKPPLSKNPSAEPDACLALREAV